jgi:hypothetical protein
MSMREMKSIYYSLLESGDLLDMFPNLTGEWVKDKKDFKRQYDMNNQALIEGYEFDEFYEDEF